MEKSFIPLIIFHANPSLLFARQTFCIKSQSFVINVRWDNPLQSTIVLADSYPSTLVLILFLTSKSRNVFPYLPTVMLPTPIESLKSYENKVSCSMFVQVIMRRRKFLDQLITSASAYIFPHIHIEIFQRIQRVLVFVMLKQIEFFQNFQVYAGLQKKSTVIVWSEEQLNRFFFVSLIPNVTKQDSFRIDKKK